MYSHATPLDPVNEADASEITCDYNFETACTYYLKD